jgi:hypothetical protein
MNDAKCAAEAGKSHVPDLVATVYSQAPVPVRSKLLAFLLGALGPLAMASLSEGTFARFLLRSPADSAFVTTEDAASISAGQLMALARYVVEANPARFGGFVDLLQLEAPAMISTVAGATLVVIVNRWLRRKERRGNPPARS